MAYALEVLPFKLRAKGMMIMNLTVQAILALSAQTNLLAWENLPHHWNFMLFYTVSTQQPPFFLPLEKVGLAGFSHNGHHITTFKVEDLPKKWLTD